MVRPPFITLRPKALRRFWQAQGGGALVEFAISLPLILLLGLLSIESMRLFWSYQAAIAGVRDATRYLARVAPANLCAPGVSQSLAGYTTRLEGIVQNTISGGTVYSGGVTITSVTPSLACITTLGLRQSSVPVATVTANLTITMPFSQILRVIGANPATLLTTSVTDQARVYGL